MAPSQAQTNPSPRPANTAGPSTASSSTTSPTGTHSTVATTVGASKPRSWDEDKSLNLYILDYCRRRKFDDTASAFEREAKITQGITNRFEAPQGLLFEWWIVFWETFNSQISQLPPPREPGSGAQSESPGQTYVNTMARLKKLAMHEKEELARSRGMNMNMGMPAMGTPAMGNMSTPAMGNMATPAMASMSAPGNMSTPGMANLPNPAMNGMHQQPQLQPQPGMGGGPGGMRPPSQASARSQSQQPVMGPGPQQPGPGMRPQQQQPGMMPNMGGMHMTPSMTHTPIRTASTPTPAQNVSSPSPVPTPPQSFSGPGSGPGPSQQPFNPGSAQSSFGPGPQPGSLGPGPGPQPGGPGAQQSMLHQGYQHPPGPGQQSFPPGGPGNPGQFAPGSGPSGSFPHGPGSGPPPGSFPPNPGPQNFPPNTGPGGPGPSGSFPPGHGSQPFPGPNPQFAVRDGMPEWGQRPPAIGQTQGGPGPQGRREGWEDGRPGMGQGPGPGMRPGPGGMMPQKPGQQIPPGMQQRMGMGPMGAHPSGPGMHQRYPSGQPGMGMPQHMMGQGQPMAGLNMGQPPNMGGGMGQPPNNMGGMPGSGQQQPMGQSPKEGSRSGTPATGWSPGDPSAIGMQRRPAMAAQGGQMGPSGPQGRPPFMGQGQGQGGIGQKRPGSPPPPQTTANMGGSPPEAKRPRQNDPGPAALADSRADGRPTSSKGTMPFGGGPPMHGGPGGHPGMMNGQPGGLQEYRQELSAAARAAIVNQGVQPPPFGKGAGKPNGAGPGPGPRSSGRPMDAPSPASGEPRQVMNVKGAAGSMGPPASPSLANRNVGNVKKSESAGSSPALASSTVPNGMGGDRSRTPSSTQSGQMAKPHGAPPSPRNGPATRPQSAAPTGNPGQGQGPSIPPAPPSSAPPMLSQSPSNGMPYNNRLSQNGPIGGEFDFGPMLDFTQLTSEFLPEDVNQLFEMGTLNDWPGDSALGTE
ncbi:hypothetical protein FRC06_008166 [Ceratobasidium sp. 370]|nr:hypothetical protein FRC06_008166 [Ceratobasidium sp. 370]